MSDTQQRIASLVQSNDVVLFMKGTASFPQCGFSGRAIQILKGCGLDGKTIATVNVLEDQEVRQGIKEYSNWPTIPQLYVKGEFIGGSDIMTEMYESGELQKVIAGDAPRHTALQPLAVAAAPIPDALTPNRAGRLKPRRGTAPAHVSRCNDPRP